jgi:hypothetical protein
MALAPHLGMVGWSRKF